MIKTLIPILLCVSAVSMGKTDAELAQSVQALFAQRCNSCHGGRRPEAGLDLTRFHRLVDSSLVNLETPDQSLLYERILSDEMPADGKSLSDEQKALVLQWLQAGAPAGPGSTVALSSDIRQKFELANKPTNDELISLELQIQDLIFQDLKYSNSADRKDFRYLTLTNLREAGATDEQMDHYRGAIAKLINSLSWEDQVAPITAIDTDKTILRFRLSEIGWTAAKWEKLVARYPYRLKFDAFISQILEKAVAGTEVPYMRGDWFAFASTLPELYHELLDLPDTLEGLEEHLGVEAAKDVKEQKVIRAGFSVSGVSQSNRIIERHNTEFGAYWKSFDFGSNVGQSNIFEFPLGKDESPTGKLKAFEHAGGEMIFNLPNGMQAYYLATAGGKRLNDAPIEIVQNKFGSDSQILNGISCMGCHKQGMRIKYDQIRDYTSGVRLKFQGDDFKTIQALYPPKEQLRAAFKKDIARFKAAVEKAGATEPAGIGELITTLVDRFNKNVDITNAAAELGVTPEELLDAAESAVEAKAVVLRLQAGGIPRDTFIETFRELSDALLFAKSESAIAGDTYTTRSGVVFTRAKNMPAMGEAWRDHAGMIWSEIQNAASIEEARKACERMGATLPSQADYQRLKQYFTSPSETGDWTLLEWQVLKRPSVTWLSNKTPETAIVSAVNEASFEFSNFAAGTTRLPYRCVIPKYSKQAATTENREGEVIAVSGGVEFVYDDSFPQFGHSFRTPEGDLWTSVVAEDVTFGNAEKICDRIGGRLPTHTDVGKVLSKLVDDYSTFKHKFFPELAAIWTSTLGGRPDTVRFFDEATGAVGYIDLTGRLSVRCFIPGNTVELLGMAKEVGIEADLSHPDLGLAWRTKDGKILGERVKERQLRYDDADKYCKSIGAHLPTEEELKQSLEPLYEMDDKKESLIQLMGPGSIWINDPSTRSGEPRRAYDEHNQFSYFPVIGAEESFRCVMDVPDSDVFVGLWQSKGPGGLIDLSVSKKDSSKGNYSVVLSTDELVWSGSCTPHESEDERGAYLKCDSSNRRVKELQEGSYSVHGNQFSLHYDEDKQAFIFRTERTASRDFPVSPGTAREFIRKSGDTKSVSY